MKTSLPRVSTPIIDLKTQYQQHKERIDAAIQRVLDHGQYINGPEVHSLEEQLADYVGVAHCIGNASGSVALQIALMALGVGAGDEVITTAFSFFSTAEVILLLGARPVYVDIDPRTYNLDPSKIEAALTKKTKAIMSVGLYGQPADLDPVNAIAEKWGLPVIDDIAQSLGASYKQYRAGALSTISCTSFFPSKPLGCYGDGGACFTNDAVLAQRMRRIINHGAESRYHHTMIGMTGRLDTLQAAVLLEKLQYLDEDIKQRQAVAARYAACLPDSVTLPYIEPFNVSTYAQYTVQLDHRDAINEILHQAGIATAIHYPKGLHQQPASMPEQAVSYPVTERAAARVLSLPCYPSMSASTVEQVAEAVSQAILQVSSPQ